MITEKMIVEETRKVIAERPDYTYKNDSCSYLECNEACVFGVVLSNLGMTQEQLASCEKPLTGFSPGISVVIAGSYHDNTFEEISNNVQAWCQRIQSKQDQKHSWRECLEMANEMYPTVLEKYPVS